jgi:hypothetical protein
VRWAIDFGKEFEGSMAKQLDGTMISNYFAERVSSDFSLPASGGVGTEILASPIINEISANKTKIFNCVWMGSSQAR